MNEQEREEFLKRREAARDRINQIDAKMLSDNPHRHGFFDHVYGEAMGDAAMVPWADLAPKDQLVEWLNEKKGSGSAIDVGCGLGDNAEALAKAGYSVTAFDVSPDGIEWARERFPNSSVNYCVADLLSLPDEWIGAFDLVSEIYTLQAVPQQLVPVMKQAVASLVKDGGTLLVFTRIRKDGADVDGPPWPLEESVAMGFQEQGFDLVSKTCFELVKGDRRIPHWFCEWKKGGS